MKQILLVFLFLFNNVYAANNSNLLLKDKIIKLYKEKHYKQVFHLLKNSHKENAFILNNLAMMYYKGLGVSPNQSKAVIILEKAIKKYPNNSNLYFNLAVMYYFGYIKNLNGEKKIYIDRTKAKNLLLKAIKLGNKKSETFYHYFYIKKYEQK